MAKAARYLQACKDYMRTPVAPSKGHTALVVIDMQEYFDSTAPAAVKGCKKLVSACRDASVPIFFTKHGYNKRGESGMLAEWWGGDNPLIKHTPEWALYDGLEALPHDEVVEKSRYNAFHKTDLEERLRAKDITDLIICGVLTNCCCEGTARDAFVRDFRVHFVVDATATASEELHLATLKNLGWMCAYLVGADDLCTTIMEQSKS